MRFYNKLSSLASRITNLPPHIVMLVSFASTSIANYSFSLAMGWLLLPGDFGLFAFVQTILLIIGLILNSGFAWSLSSAISKAEHAQRAALIRGSFIANLALSFVLSALILILFGLGLLTSGLESWSIAIIVSATIPFLAIVAILNGSMRGSERFGHLAFLRILEMATKAICGVVLVLMGYGVVGAILGSLLGAALTAVIGSWRLARVIKMKPWGAIEQPSLRITQGMFGALLGFALLLNLDVLAIKLFSGTAREITGHYQSAIVLANLPYYMSTAMMDILFPRLARLKSVEPGGVLISSTLRLVLIFLVPLEIVMFLFPSQVLGLAFPSRYIDGAAALRILAVGNCALIFTQVLCTAFNAADRPWTSARILFGVVACEVIALAIIVPRYGMIGAAAMFSLACTSALVLLSWIYIKNVGTAQFQNTGRWLAKYGALVLVISGLMILLQAVSHSLILAGTLSGLCYLVGVVWLQWVPLPDFVLKPFQRVGLVIPGKE